MSRRAPWTLAIAAGALAAGSLAAGCGTPTHQPLSPAFRGQAAQAAHAAGQPAAAFGARVLTGQWLIKLAPGAKPAAWARRHGLRHAGAIGLGIHRFTSLTEAAPPARDPEMLWREADQAISLPADRGRAWAGGLPPALRAPQAGSADDPLIPAQYGRAITGVDRLWDVQRGSPDVIVAVIDSGVDASHPEFAGQLLPGWDVTVEPPRAGGDVDGYGHGTHVAGVIGAKADNGVGIAGVAPGCKILPVRIFNNFGHSTTGASAAAVIWAVDHGAKVINASWGSPLPGAATEAAYQYALDKDVVFVSAVGNSGSNETKSYPGATEGVIGVAATTDIDTWGSFSTWGDWVDLAAPGEGILSTHPTALGNGYRIMRGTSMASPLVAGVAALVRSQHPGWSRTQVAERLYGTAKDVIQNGLDPYSGHGRVDAFRAVTEAR